MNRKKSPSSARPATPAKNWCGCSCPIRTRELTAVTSRQYAGQTLAQIFPKFAHHPRARTLRFTEPKAELLARQAQIVFLALPHGVAAEFAVPLLQRAARSSI